MYHDKIRINFKSAKSKSVDFDYSFIISKNFIDGASPIKYIEILKKFESIGLDINYVKFNDTEDNHIVYCSYNYSSDFMIFFRAYDKVIKNYNFHLTFDYGNVIGGFFKMNNMNSYSRIYFSYIPEHMYNKENIYTIIKGHYHTKTYEQYQIIDSFGSIIHAEIANKTTNFENNFFNNIKVKIELRKYKLSKLNIFN